MSRFIGPQLKKMIVKDVLLRAMNSSDKQLLLTANAIHEEARRNYLTSIWSGIVDRSRGRIAKETEGEVVIKTFKQVHELAQYLEEEVDLSTLKGTQE